MMKKVAIAVAAVLVLSCLVFGFDKVSSWMGGTRQVINDRVDEGSPISLEVARIRWLIGRKREEMLSLEDRVVDLEGRHEHALRTLAALKKDLHGEKTLLGRIKVMLDARQETYRVGLHEYAFAEVNTDALERVEDCKRMAEAVALQESVVRDLRDAVEQGGRNLAKVRSKLHELEPKLARLEARDTNADIRAEVASLTESVQGSLFGADDELSAAFRNLERRVAGKERRATARLGSGRTTHRIDYTPVVVTEEASSEIARFLNGPGQEETGVSSLAARPAPVAAVKDDASR